MIEWGETEQGADQGTLFDEDATEHGQARFCPGLYLIHAAWTGLVVPLASCPA